MILTQVKIRGSILEDFYRVVPAVSSDVTDCSTYGRIVNAWYDSIKVRTGTSGPVTAPGIPGVMGMHEHSSWLNSQ